MKIDRQQGATTVAALMEVMNKLNDTDEALVNQFHSNANLDVGASDTAGDSSSKL
jgi:hypothetical protein